MNVFERTERYILGTYGRQPLALVRGEGARVWDDRGRSYLDFLGGIAVCSLGHCHPAVVRAVREQAGTLMHASNLYHTAPAAALAEALAGLGVGEKVFFCNSGAEANEGAFKLVRKHFHRRGQPRRQRILALEGSFHGRTLATLAATDRPDFREGFGAMPPGFAFVPFGDAAALETALDDTVAAVVLEPVQGEGGLRVAPAEYLREVRRLCDRAGALLIADEIQSGLGRTGTFLAIEAANVVPDVVTLAKGLAGGLPLGAFAARGEVAGALRPGDHGSTFGGNPVCCAAALAVLEVIASERLVARAGESGELLRRELADRLPKGRAVEFRGRGLMLGVALDFEGAGVVAEARERGLLINCTAGNVLRFLPPLNVSGDEVREAARRTAEAVAAAVEGGTA